MKNFILIITFCFTSKVHSQCEYSLIEYDDASGQGILKTYPITLDFFETPMNGRIVMAYLLRKGNKYFIEIEITEDSSSLDLQPICFNAGSRLSFLLKDNSTISLPHVNEKICGIKTKDRKTDYTSISSYGVFILTQEAFNKLLKSEVNLLRIFDKDYNKSFVLKEELEEFIKDEIIISNPSRFFIDNIDCMTNPKFK